MPDVYTWNSGRFVLSRVSTFQRDYVTAIPKTRQNPLITELLDSGQFTHVSHVHYMLCNLFDTAR